MSKIVACGSIGARPLRVKESAVARREARKGHLGRLASAVLLLRLSFVQNVVHSRCCRISQTGDDVRVGVEGDRDSRVAEHLGDALRVDTAHEQQRGARVAKVVEAYRGQIGTLETRAKVPGVEVVAVRGVADSAGKGQEPSLGSVQSGRLPYPSTETAAEKSPRPRLRDAPQRRETGSIQGLGAFPVAGYRKTHLGGFSRR